MQEVPNSIRGQVSVSNYKMKTTFREVIYFFKAGLDSAGEDQDCLPFKRQEENQEQEEVRVYKHQYKDHGTEIIPHTCPFWYTATLFRPVKTTPKST